MHDDSPYRSPQQYDFDQQQYANVPRPGVVTWYMVYVSLLVLLYGLLALFGLVMLTMGSTIAADDPTIDAQEIQIVGAIYGGLGLLLCLLFAVGLFAPRKKWGWIYAIVLIAIGMTSCCTLPATIPLLIFWLKPETKAYYGMMP